MNGDNHNTQVGRAARINFYGEPQILLTCSAAQSADYEKAFFSGNDNWDNAYSLNTATWD